MVDPDLLKIAASKRETLKASTNAIRLVNSMGDDEELSGLILEQYHQHFVAQIFDERWLKEKKLLRDFVKEQGGVYLVIKDRTESASSHPDDIKRNVWIEHNSSQTIVEENGLNFGVDLNDTLNTGLFLDMRHNRKVVSGLAANRKVLNCFAYTCSFGVYCRHKGAISVVNVDVSKKSLDRGRANYELNGIVPEKNEFIRADAVEYLEKAVKKDNRFDLIILDPPSFARHEGKIFSVKKDLAGLIANAVKVLNPDGVLFVSTNLSDMNPEYLEDLITEAAKNRTVKKVDYFGQDQDFPGSGLMSESCLSAVLVILS
ncbi:MAG: class I SAM-dependent rRNA methyltransferase [Candidatus Omnitrophica bacterium]|nr:class I SAM-dependent rRNA methyltransferase [Candidatus Omnitrophota bacterium]